MALVVLQFSVFSLLAQTAGSTTSPVAEDLKKISAKYSSGDLSMSFKYSYFYDINVNTPNKVLTGEMKQKGELYYYKLDQTEVMRTANHIVMLDRKHKSLMLDTVIGNPEPQSSSTIPIDSLIQFYGTIEVKDEGDYRTYKLMSPLEGISHTLLKVNTQSWTIKSIEVYFYENRPGKDPESIRNKMVIDYTNFQEPCKQGKSFFDVAKYVSYTKNKYQAKPAFRQYTFMNNLD